LLYIVYKAYGKDSDIADSVEQLLTITEQYYREAGWKSPEEVASVWQEGYLMGLGEDSEIKHLIDRAAEIIGTDKDYRSTACIEVALDWLQGQVKEREGWKSPKEVEERFNVIFNTKDKEVK
jgi:hypothetical protein